MVSSKDWGLATMSWRWVKYDHSLISENITPFWQVIILHHLDILHWSNHPWCPRPLLWPHERCGHSLQGSCRNGLLRYTIHTSCPKLWCNPCSKCYGVDCFGTYFTHVQGCDVVVYKVLRSGLLRCFTHVQSCDVCRVQSAREWTASVHNSHVSPVM